MLNRKRRNSARLRTAACARRGKGGWTLAEALVASLVGMMIAGSMMEMLSSNMRVSTGAKNYVLASGIAQQVLDIARNTPYRDLSNMPPNQTLSINLTEGGNSTSQLCPRALLIDLNDVTKDWTGSNNLLADNMAESNAQILSVRDRFDGTCTVNIAPGPVANTLQVTVTLNWNDSGAPKRYQTQTLICKHGISNQ